MLQVILPQIINVADRRTDRQTTYDDNSALGTLAHSALKFVQHLTRILSSMNKDATFRFLVHIVFTEQL